MTPLILASTSASRHALLRAAGMAFEAVAPGIDEHGPKATLLDAGASPRDIALALATLKAQSVSRRRAGLVLGADQTLDLDGALFDKPVDLADARKTLVSLRGKTHALHSAAVVAQGGAVLWSTVATARLTMWPFDDAFLNAYLEDQGAAVLSSVGAYLLEGRGIQLFSLIEGDYFGILGLPLLPLLAFLRVVDQ